jgi:polar amino acid transport system substrate-binding protein
MRFLSLLCPLFFCLFNAIPSNASASEILVVGAEFASVFERSAAGNFSGLGVSIIQELAKQNGDTVKFEIYPWNRAQWMVENGQAHILIGPYKTPERELRFSFAKRAFYRDVMTFYTRASSNFTWNGNLTGLLEAKIGTIHGWVYGPEFENMRPKLKLELANSLTNGLNMLIANRVDYLASNVRNTNALAKTLGITKDIKLLNPEITVTDGYLAYCKLPICDQLRERYDGIFEQLKNTGKLDLLAKFHQVTVP